MNLVIALGFAILSVCSVIGSPVDPPLLFGELQHDIDFFDIANKDDFTYRLPNNTIPLDYDITIWTKVHEGIFDFKGHVIINIVALEETNKIVIHARQLKNFEAELSDLEGNKFDVVYQYDETTEFLTFTPKDEKFMLTKDKTYKLDLKYEGTLRRDNAGFYLSSYVNANKETVYLATTQYESTDARHGFPCYDEPALKAKFTITIHHGENYHAISNMPVNTKDSKPGVTVFEETPKMSTYLIAYVVSDFESTSADAKAFTQRVFSRPGTKNLQEFALQTAVKTLKEIEKYVGVDYSFPKMDQVAVPDFAAGAMENWALVTYREEYLLYDTKKSTVGTQTSIATIISHEYGHQWFGNLVSPKWWTYTWLNEGFASLFTYIGSDLVFPEWNIMEDFMVSEYQRALGYDGRKNPRPMSFYVEKPREISALFDSVSYSKAACVIRMMQHMLSEKVFTHALTKYLTAHAYSAAEEDDLFNAFQQAAKDKGVPVPATIKEIMGSWTNQGGYPILTLTRNYDDGSFSINQKSFSDDPSHSDDRIWYVPYNFVTGNNPDFDDTTPDNYMKKTNTVTEKPTEERKWSNEDWIVLNKQTTGYYRVNYDEKNWNLIIEGLLKDHKKIHSYNRAQLINDAHKFSVSKRLPHETLFKLLAYLKKEENYAPWATANIAINDFYNFLRADENFELFKYYLKDIIGDIFKSLGVVDKESDNHYQKYTRNIAINWACIAGMKECLENTNKRIKDLIENDKKIEPNLQTVIYCNGLRQANEKEFDYLFDHLMKSSDQAERHLIISSLGCVEDDKHIKKFIESSLSSDANYHAQEKIIVLRSVYSKSAKGLLASIEFLSKNFKKYADIPPGYLGTNPLSDDIKLLASFVITGKQHRKLEELVELVKDHPKVDKDLKQFVTTTVQANMDWVKQNRDPVVNYLKKFKANGAASLIASTIPVLIVLSTLVTRYV